MLHGGIRLVRMDGDGHFCGLFSFYFYFELCFSFRQGVGVVLIGDVRLMELYLYNGCI